MRKVLILVLIGSLFLPGLARAGEWYDKVKLKGDFRHRHEFIDDASKEDPRTRWRIRARLALDAALADNWSAHLRLATGGDDPVSTNQTIGDGFSTKDFGLDRAYWDFHPNSIEGLHFRGGKMGNPLIVMQKTELMWDNDLSPAGAAFVWTHEVNETFALLLTGMFQYVQERKDDNDTRMAGGQAGAKVKAGESSHFIIGGGFFDYENMKDYRGVFDPDDFYGNTSVEAVFDGDTVDVYAWDYSILEAFGEFGFKFDKHALSFYGDYVNNTQADSMNTGWLVGGIWKYGKGKGAIKLYANYREIEADAVLGVYTDSDFIGGGTDGKGFEIGGGYTLIKNVDLGVTYLGTKKGIEEEIDYKRLQLDLKLKF